MLAKVSCVLLLLFVLQNTGTATPLTKDLSEYDSAYYNPKTGVGLKPTLEENSVPSKISYRGLSCGCKNLECSCCAGIKIKSIHFNQNACIKLALVPKDSAIRLSLNLNDKQIYSASVSIKDLPPLCIKVPKISAAKVCLRIYNLRIEGKNLQGCVDLETRVTGKAILVLHFNCLNIAIGRSSLGVIQNETNLVPLEVDGAIADLDIYDDYNELDDFEVDFEPQDREVSANSTSMLSPKEEVEIGELKL
ncbi:uncharacterized protein LOC116427719 isoform X2 [Nomia melanderi]|uniref:uncharacterized protein LOC116427719 isoform X2 n=1 Tax=Nomia melanderi TaxID=2448451 RepID=UPI001304390B|nr:uncharacterized protein LOC116427719 isoform X2 [Nomia melanderi]